MTSEERLDRIEHLTAGIAEERRKDREEYKALWRDTQRQLNEVSVRLVQLSEADSRLEARIEQLAEESRAANKEMQAANKDLQERIAALVSGFGKFIAENRK
jgi:chromosome segregation ATPase